VSRRSRIVGFGSAALLILAGAVCAVAVEGELGAILALALISLGCVDAVSLVFAEVGFSEDRERARQEERRRKTSSPARPARRRLDRMRGRRRRLR
jgi:hypothetical protein